MPEKEFTTEEEVFLWYCTLHNLGPSALLRSVWLAGRASIRDVPDDFVIQKTRKIKELEKELKLAQVIVESVSSLDEAKSPCGHFEVYAYTEDGGKNIVCTVCEMKKLQVQLRAEYVLMFTAGLPDGPDLDTVCSVGMTLVPSELKGPLTPQEYDLATMKIRGQAP
jgi:hypothetical protein